jgi:hypothetical protein
MFLKKMQNIVSGISSIAEIVHRLTLLKKKTAQKSSLENCIAIFVILKGTMTRDFPPSFFSSSNTTLGP